MDDLPKQTQCGECGASVALAADQWMNEEERGGANQICWCGQCGATAFAIVGTDAYVRGTLLAASRFVGLRRRHASRRRHLN